MRHNNALWILVHNITLFFFFFFFNIVFMFCVESYLNTQEFNQRLNRFLSRFSRSVKWSKRLHKHGLCF